MEKFYIEIVKFGKHEEVVKLMGPMDYRKAYIVDNGLNRNLNHAKYFTRIIEA